MPEASGCAMLRCGINELIPEATPHYSDLWCLSMKRCLGDSETHTSKGSILQVELLDILLLLCDCTEWCKPPVSSEKKCGQRPAWNTSASVTLPLFTSARQVPHPLFFHVWRVLGHGPTDFVLNTLFFCPLFMLTLRGQFSWGIEDFLWDEEKHVCNGKTKLWKENNVLNETTKWL